LDAHFGRRGVKYDKFDGHHYFDTFAEDAIFESRYHFSGWPSMIRGRADLMASFSGYGKTIKLHSGDALVVRHSRESRHDSGIQSARQDSFEWRTLRQQVHFGDLEKRKIIHWRDYMDSLAAWTALNSAS